jgi:ribonuclease HI
LCFKNNFCTSKKIPLCFKKIKKVKKQKYYVVWEGKKTGVYASWDECKKQVDGQAGAKYKSFDTKAEADAAFKKDYWAVIGKSSPTAANAIKKPSTRVKNTSIIWESMSVDAACSGNPGAMEYKGVWTKTGEELFHQGPFPDGTNNIGEFLALVHALAYLQRSGNPNMVIYSDSKIAQGWIKKGVCNTKLEPTKRNAPIFDLIERAEKWLATNKITNPVLKWETDDWGEIPADFGRK